MDTAAILNAGGLSLLSGLARRTGATGSRGASGGFGPAAVVDLGRLGARTASAILDARFFSKATLPPAAQAQRDLVRKRDIVEAQTALVDRQFEKVRDVAQGMLARDPDDAAANHLIARSFQAEGRTHEASEFYRRAADQAPGDERFAADLRNSRLLERSDTAVLNAAGDMLSSPLTQGDGLRLLSALAERSESAGTLTALGDALWGIRAKQQALGAYALSLEHASGSELAEVLERADRVVSDSPQAAVAQDFRGRVLLKMSRFDEAIAAYKSARDLEPVDRAYVEHLSDAYVARGRARIAEDDLSGGKADLLEARALRPGNQAIAHDLAEVRVGLARQLMLRGSLTSALGELNSALVTYPTGDEQLKRTMAGLYYSLGNRFSGDGELVTAASTFQRAYDLNPSLTHRKGLAGARNLLGLQYYDEGRFEDAVTQFEAALELFSGNAEYAANLELARSHVQTGGGEG